MKIIREVKLKKSTHFDDMVWSFIKQILVLNPSARPTAKMVQNSDWVQFYVSVLYQNKNQLICFVYN